ncbi:MAG TPA: glycoside hydrolase family 97 N-terminal domain-containing protein, partial [Puia sp.]|nr:glycoside hydrolase family 97 N-terminal domain-containing protein [Puia sp.]
MRITASIAVSLVLFGLSGRVFAQNARVYDLTSPGGINRISVSPGSGGLLWGFYHRGQLVLAPSELALQLRGGELLDGHSLDIKATRESRDEVILPLHYKRDTIHDRYNQLTLLFAREGYGVIFRAYDDGVAYRWFTRRKDSLTIQSEKAD